jgi:hypothetical protein
VPWEVVEEIGVMDEAIKTRVGELLAGASGAFPAPRVIVRSGWYDREKKS